MYSFIKRQRAAGILGGSDVHFEATVGVSFQDALGLILALRLRVLAEGLFVLYPCVSASLADHFVLRTGCMCNPRAVWILE